MNTLAVLLTSENLQCCLCQSLSVSGNQTPRQQPVKMRGREGERKGRKEEKRKRGKEEEGEGGGKRKKEVKEGGGEGEVMFEDKNTLLLDGNLLPPPSRVAPKFVSNCCPPPPRVTPKICK